MKARDPRMQRAGRSSRSKLPGILSALEERSTERNWIAAHHSGCAEDGREGLSCRGERVDITVPDGGHGDQRKVARGGDVLELGARPVVRRQLRLPIPNLRQHKNIRVRRVSQT